MPHFQSTVTHGYLASDLPYDVLREIFLHCLPQYPLEEEPQPNRWIAPMLLCQVCSSWRIVALSAPALWSHLNLYLHVEWNDKSSGLLTCDPDAFAKDIEFLKWWKTNQRSMSPFLHIIIFHSSGHVFKSEEEERQPLYYIDDDVMDFISEYISSAQYLDLEGELYVPLVKHWTSTESGTQMDFPNLHTLKTVYFDEIPWGSLDMDIPYATKFLREYIAPILSQRVSAVRRLSLEDAKLPPIDPNLFTNWLTLTHLDLNYMDIYLNAWFQLLSAVPSLQWGYFSFNIKDSVSVFHRPPVITLSDLSTLCVTHWASISNSAMTTFPLTTLVENLHMPVLQNLLLFESESNPWTELRVASELKRVLLLAPWVKMLSLGPLVPSFDDGSHPPIASGHIEPLQNYAPNLAHLELRCKFRDVSTDDAIVQLGKFVERVFFSNGWIYLSSPTNVLRRITMEMERASPTTKDSVMAAFAKHVAEVPNVTFDVDVPLLGDLKVLRAARRAWSLK